MRPAPLIGGNADASSQMAWESHTPRLAAELADAGVTVNVLHTGIVDTAIYSWIMSQPPELIGAWVRDLFVGFRERGVLITPGRSATALNSQLAGIGTGEFGMSTTDPDTPDGRHLTRKGQATRQRIIAAAARLLEERGVAGVSVGDVQQAASVSAGQVYHYFPGKQALIRTVVRHRFRVTMDAQRPRLDHLDNLGALCAWRDLLVETQSRMTDAPRGLSIMAGELLRGVPECQPELVRGFDEWLNAISNGLRAMRDRGDLLPSADPDRLATGLLAAVQGGSLLACVHRDANRLGAALDEVIDHIALLIPDINADRARYHTTHRTEPHG